MSKNLRRLFFRGENKAVWEVPYAVRRRVGGGARWLASPSSIFFLSSPQTGFSPGEEEMGMTRSQHCRPHSSHAPSLGHYSGDSITPHIFTQTRAWRRRNRVRYTRTHRTQSRPTATGPSAKLTQTRARLVCHPPPSPQASERGRKGLRASERASAPRKVGSASCCRRRRTRTDTPNMQLYSISYR